MNLMTLLIEPAPTPTGKDIRWFVVQSRLIIVHHQIQSINGTSDATLRITLKVFGSGSYVNATDVLDSSCSRNEHNSDLDGKAVK